MKDNLKIAFAIFLTVFYISEPASGLTQEQIMTYTAEVEHMCPLAKGAYHGPAPIPEEGEWVKVKKIEDVSGFTHGIGWCAPQQGACKLSLNIKKGIIEEALVESYQNNR